MRAELRKRDYAAGLFCDAINVRYVTGSRNMQVWTLRNPARYVFVATDGPTVMFEFGGCDHLVRGLETIQEIRPATSWFYFTSGPRIAERAYRWAEEIADLVLQHGSGNRRLAVDRSDRCQHIVTAVVRGFFRCNETAEKHGPASGVLARDIHAFIQRHRPSGRTIAPHRWTFRRQAAGGRRSWNSSAIRRECRGKWPSNCP